MNISDGQAAKLQSMEDTPLSFPEVSDTQGDITVSAAQCLLDENNMRLAFYVDGYELEYLNVLLDGKPVYNYDWEFYSGIDWTENREPRSKIRGIIRKFRGNRHSCKGIANVHLCIL